MLYHNDHFNGAHQHVSAGTSFNLKRKSIVTPHMCYTCLTSLLQINFTGYICDVFVPFWHSRVLMKGPFKLGLFNLIIKAALFWI